MSPVWRRRFITRGILIAVFGMRILFPLIIVSIVGDVWLSEALSISLHDHDRYQALITQSHIPLAWFGGSFLLMVFLAFFLDEAKEIHRIQWIEKQLSKRGKRESAEVIVALGIILLTSKLPWFPAHEVSAFLAASMAGIITYLLVSSISSLLQAKDHTQTSYTRMTWWLGTFLYLEVLDASFSFDGVIGAFALTKNIILIALWLGIGAMFVRSMTIMLVEKQTLSRYTFLEHGAFRAIGALALCMFLGSVYHIPEVIIWGISGVLIALSVIRSIYSNRKETTH